MTDLEKWATGRANVLLLRRPRLSVTNNFFTVRANPDTDRDCFAFCDQDDFWLPEKVERAALALREHSADEPLLHCSRVEYVDENLKHLGFSKVPRRIGFANALVENIATGCTMVLDRCARDLICERLPQKARLYDWYCYLTAFVLGKVMYNERPSIKYCQHANNVTGAATTRWNLFRRRFVRFLRHKKGTRLMSDQGIEFQCCFGNLLNTQDKKTPERFLSVRGSFGERVFYSAAMDVWRQSWSDTMTLRALILMGRV